MQDVVGAERVGPFEVAAVDIRRRPTHERDEDRGEQASLVEAPEDAGNVPIQSSAEDRSKGFQGLTEENPFRCAVAIHAR